MSQVVKICGLKSVAEAEVAASSGAHLLGVIVVPNRARTVDPEQARQISQLCKARRRSLGREFVDSRKLLEHLRKSDAKGPDWFRHCARLIIENGPYLVGVFRNQPLDDVVKLSQDLELDFVQLHGSEDFSLYANHLDLPVIARYVLSKPNIAEATKTHLHVLPLLDSELGGEGRVINWEDAEEFNRQYEGVFLLAGGLNPDNVRLALSVQGCLGVDVSGGVETDGVKDLEKIRHFIATANYVE
ncbi:hypothetical protein KL930_002837 [Ogataea haglerorum]|uniref:N-(5'-phosphoribosyl)anthranilate isomerase n=1 Tax=Ogataea haglerorum TaxID=1937702 RepID=A0ABQ7RGT3_9ASCO|nr:hypothetical protein KL915_004988 [Ogataea haglerorum]KAG7702861.1 hypothetical protein KL950_004939 [Ogataea haglerorum]KAG7702958.1 hypothetical protein KL914_004963 [Ogataea haglerorum]KAG7734232.1 hypothetical protein KL932_004907 [Ogataea haglerorum]KAG7754299.1 hypothetical protein KL947_004921 [Ogataea haglerorum]